MQSPLIPRFSALHGITICDHLQSHEFADAVTVMPYLNATPWHVNARRVVCCSLDVPEDDLRAVQEWCGDCVELFR
jgi:hypothetical protein